MGRPAPRVDKDLTVVVRPRTPQDLAVLVTVAARVREADGYPAYLPGNDLLRFLTTPTSLGAWVAEADGAVVGHVALNSESHPAAMAVVRAAGIAGPVGVIARLLVDPAARRQRLGARLLEEATTDAISQDRIPVLDVVSSATAAITLYRASGWEELGRCKFENSGHAPIEEIIFARGVSPKMSS